MLIGKSVGIGARDFQSRIVGLALHEFAEHGQASDDFRLFQQVLNARNARMAKDESELFIPRARNIDFGCKLFKRLVHGEGLVKSHPQFKCKGLDPT